MTSKLKILALALAATFALGAVASSASAYQLHSGSGSGTTYLTAQQVSANNILHTPAGTIKCSGASGKGSFTGSTAPQGTVENVALSGCTAFGLTMHVDTMGCDFLITGNGATSGILHIVCPTTAGGVTDEITVLPTQGGVPVCQLDVPEQTTSIVIGNTGSPPDDIHNSLANETNLTYSVTYTPADHTKTKCGTQGVHHDGGLTSTITVKAYSDASHTTQVNLTYQ